MVFMNCKTLFIRQFNRMKLACGGPDRRLYLFLAGMLEKPGRSAGEIIGRVMTNCRRGCRRADLGALMLSGSFGAAEAVELKGEWIFEMQNEYTFESDDQALDDQNNIFARSELIPIIEFNEHWELEAMFVLEPMQERDHGEDNYFEEEGVFVEQLKINYSHGPWSAVAGKFNPGFGIAWDFGRGIWGEDFNEEYQLLEKIGFGAAYVHLTNTMGEYSLELSTFFEDTTFLSESLGTSRGHKNYKDGGASNTEDFASFVVQTNGVNVFGIENLFYKAAFRYLSEGSDDQDEEHHLGGDDEQGFLLTIGHVFPISDRLEADILIEYTNLENFEAGPDDYQYFTYSMVTRWDRRWNLTFSYTNKDVDVKHGDDHTDHLLQLTGGYDFGQGTTFEMGWRNSEEEGENTNYAGALIRHRLNF